jgi:N-acetylmuramoyl-L-alanine amidase
MGNRRKGRYDPGVCHEDLREADIAMEWVNELRNILREQKVAVVRTRVDQFDAAPVGQRAQIARRYKGDIMVSFHCNWAGNSKVSGTETFIRGTQNYALGAALNTAVVRNLGTVNRGVKNESQSQHTRLAIMAFQPCFLIELGFMSNAFDRGQFTDTGRRKAACLDLAYVLTSA